VAERDKLDACAPATAVLARRARDNSAVAEQENSQTDGATTYSFTYLEPK
jgi:hypothetical protein